MVDSRRASNRAQVPVNRGVRSWFIRRIESMLQARGRRPIGWDEIHLSGAKISLFAKP